MVINVYEQGLTIQILFVLFFSLRSHFFLFFLKDLKQLKESEFKELKSTAGINIIHSATPVEPEPVFIDLNKIDESDQDTSDESPPNDQQKIWESFYKQLLEYKERYGNVDVPIGNKIINKFYGLGKWLQNQK